MFVIFNIIYIRKCLSYRTNLVRTVSCNLNANSNFYSYAIKSNKQMLNKIKIINPIYSGFSAAGLAFAFLFWLPWLPPSPTTHIPAFLSPSMFKSPLNLSIFHCPFHLLSIKSPLPPPPPPHPLSLPLPRYFPLSRRKVEAKKVYYLC